MSEGKPQNIQNILNKMGNPIRLGTKARLQNLMGKLCIELGFCLEFHDIERISSIRPIEAEQFAMEVIKAEGLDYEYDIKWRREIRNIFIEYFGSNIAY
ncbi:MAG: hypothetical protein KTR21_04835 [Rhodobacteraceae bacterium]|nr:hypothetical protein [Paracoccaceae bacterium]